MNACRRRSGQSGNRPATLASKSGRSRCQLERLMKRLGWRISQRLARVARFSILLSNQSHLTREFAEFAGAIRSFHEGRSGRVGCAVRVVASVGQTSL